jgi:hypothetical protein
MKELTESHIFVLVEAKPMCSTPDIVPSDSKVVDVSALAFTNPLPAPHYLLILP